MEEIIGIGLIIIITTIGMEGVVAAAKMIIL
jgi:hypothetical protein